MGATESGGGERSGRTGRTGRRPPGGRQGAGAGRRRGGGSRGRGGSIGLARVLGTEDEFELVHPRCVRELEPDLLEAIELWKLGEAEDARDALRLILGECPENLAVHVALGRIALEEFGDPQLARGHFGYAVELGRGALPGGFRGRLPRERPANAPLHEALEGLTRCLRRLGLSGEADGVERLRRLLAEGPRPRSRSSVSEPSGAPSRAGGQVGVASGTGQRRDNEGPSKRNRKASAVGGSEAAPGASAEAGSEGAERGRGLGCERD